MRRSKGWSITGWAAVAIAPFAILAGLVLRLLPLKKTKDRSPGEVAGYISDFVEGTGGEWDWDHFTSVPITDPRLEAIRSEADAVSLPADEAGLKNLRALAVRARSLRPLA